MPVSKSQSYKKPIVIGLVVAHVLVVIGIIVAILSIGLRMHDAHSKTISPQQGSASTESGKISAQPQGLADFFKTDGSVDLEKVNHMLGNVPTPLRGQVPRMLEGHLRTAIDAGAISEEQAAALRQAFRVAIEKDS